MRLDKNMMQDAIDSRLSGLSASPARRARIWAAVRAEKKPVRISKLTRTLLAACLAVLVLGGTALAASTNLFDYFSRQEQTSSVEARYGAVAEQAAVENAVTVSVETEELGQAEAWIDSAYYDGYSLVVGFIIQNSERVEVFIPTEEQLAQMTVSDSAIIEAIMPGDTVSEAYEQYLEAVQAGMPFGYVSYSVSASDHTLINDSIDPVPYTGVSSSADGLYYELREFSLTEESQELDTIELSIRLYESVTYVYYDGEVWYLSSERAEAETMTATVSRTEVQPAYYTGTGDIDGVSCVATAQVLPMYTTVTVTAGEAVFQEDWTLAVYDENGTALTSMEAASLDGDALTLTLLSTGDTPQSLTVYAFSTAEDYPLEEDIQALACLTLTPAN